MDVIRSFIRKSMGSEIALLEARRMKHFRHGRFTTWFAISLLAHIPAFFITNEALRLIVHQLILLSNIILSYLAFFRFRDDDRLYWDYRRKVIPRLLRHINSKYKYYPNARIHAKEFVSSGLYYSKLNKLTRTDLILGLFNKAAFSLSYVKAQTREFIGKSGITGTANNTMITRFQGLHYVFKVPLRFTGKTLILPLGKTQNRELDEMNVFNLHAREKSKGTRRIFSGNHEFDSQFAIFTSFEKEARNFLNEKRISDLMEISGLFRNTIALSFFGSFVFLHAHTGEEVFKVDVSKPIDIDQVADNYLNLKIALEAVRILLS